MKRMRRNVGVIPLLALTLGLLACRPTDRTDAPKDPQPATIEPTQAEPVATTTTSSGEHTNAPLMIPHDLAIRAATRIVATAVLKGGVDRLEEPFLWTVRRDEVMHANDNRLALSYGIGMPAMQFGFSEHRLTGDTALRALAASNAEDVGGDLEIVLCDALTPKDGSLFDCYRSILSSGEPRMAKAAALLHQMSQCSNAITERNRGAIDAVAALIERPLVFNESGVALPLIGDDDEPNYTRTLPTLKKVIGQTGLDLLTKNRAELPEFCRPHPKKRTEREGRGVYERFVRDPIPLVSRRAAIDLLGNLLFAKIGPTDARNGPTCYWHGIIDRDVDRVGIESRGVDCTPTSDQKIDVAISMLGIAATEPEIQRADSAASLDLFLDQRGWCLEKSEESMSNAGFDDDRALNHAWRERCAGWVHDPKLMSELNKGYDQHRKDSRSCALAIAKTNTAVVDELTALVAGSLRRTKASMTFKDDPRHMSIRVNESIFPPIADHPLTLPAPGTAPDFCTTAASE